MPQTAAAARQSTAIRGRQKTARSIWLQWGHDRAVVELPTTANGSQDWEVLFKSSEDKFATSWARDGRFLLYTVNHPKTKSDIWLLPLTGDRKRPSRDQLVAN